MRIRPAPYITRPIRPCTYKQPGDPGYSHRPAPGQESVTEEEMAHFLAVHPEWDHLRGYPRVLRALTYIARFGPKLSKRDFRAPL